MDRFGHRVAIVRRRISGQNTEETEGRLKKKDVGVGNRLWSSAAGDLAVDDLATEVEAMLHGLFLGGEEIGGAEGLLD